MHLLKLAIVSTTDLEARVAAVEKLADNTGESLAGICEAIDGIQSTSSDPVSEPFQCCVNREDNKMFCATSTIADAIGINTSNGPNTCDTSNTATFCLPD